ncbi:MAG: ribbon-helix-helix domain-containing protein [Gemmatimonadales bacterium]|jgi:hypothetical protein
MIRTQISFQRELYEAARREARRQGISLAELVRRAVSQLLARHPAEHAWMRFAGTAGDAGPEASQTVDAVVYGRDRP